MSDAVDPADLYLSGVRMNDDWNMEARLRLSQQMDERRARRVVIEPPRFGDPIEIFEGHLHLHLSIQTRPAWCDRGRWLVLADALPSTLHIDGPDGFPRYFFKWPNLIDEMNEWLKTRGIHLRLEDANKQITERPNADHPETA